MAKGETKKTNTMLDQERAKANNQFDSFTQTQQGRSNDAYGRSNQAYDAIFKGYNDMAGGNTLAGIGPGGFGGGSAVPQHVGLSGTYGAVKGSYADFMNGGGVDVGAMREGHGTLRNLSDTGGFDAETRARVMGDIGRYRQFAETGGIDEAARGRMRGAGVFDDFAQTGGVSAGDAANLRKRATSGVPAFYGAMSEDMNRARRIGGGSSAMGNAAALKLARERSRGVSEAALNAELGITDRVREGKQWGAGNIAQSEGALQQLLTGNKLAGIGGALGGEMNLANSVAGTRLGAATNLGASEQNIQGIVQKGKMYGTSGMQDIAGIETDDAQRAASLAAAGANASADSASADAKFREQLRQHGLAGLMDLRGQAPGEVGMYDQNILQGIGGRAGFANEGIGMRYGAPGNNKSAWDTVGQIAGAGAGLVGGLMTGGASTIARRLPSRTVQWG